MWLGIHTAFLARQSLVITALKIPIFHRPSSLSVSANRSLSLRVLSEFITCHISLESSREVPVSESCMGTSLVVQRLRICLPLQGTQVQSPVCLIAITVSLPWWLGPMPAGLFPAYCLSPAATLDKLPSLEHCGVP